MACKIVLAEADKGKVTLVLDLDETLVHSSFRPIPNPDFVIPVEIEGKVVDVYVLKRPHMDHFMAEVGSRFEVVVFTASLSKYAGTPLLLSFSLTVADALLIQDSHGSMLHRLLHVPAILQRPACNM